MFEQKISKIYQYIFHTIAYYYDYISKSSIYREMLSRFYGVSIAKKSNQTLSIDYLYEGKKYTVYIPYERKYIHRMMNANVEIHFESSKKSIQQQPGVPYLITPKHLGGLHGLVYSIDGEKRIGQNEKIDV